MAWVINRACVGKLLNITFNHTSVVNPAGKNLFLSKLTAIQTANISGKSLRDKSKQRPPPYPYKTKNYGFINAIFDKTTWRFDENSKIIVVEGPIGVGKTSFAKELADDLDMLHLPECNMDMQYINEYGYDLRQLDPQLPESCRSFDIKNFYENPNHVNVAAFQIGMYQLRFCQYIDALVHLLSTGQGVILERSVFSDFVFLETMVKFGYVSKGAQSVYYDIRNNTLPDLLKPHLIIYLDIPVSKVQERIKSRNNQHELKTKVLTNEYLKSLEEGYKQRYLKEASANSEMLVYDWSDFGDVEVVVEDIERINFDQYGKYDTKLEDWRFPDEWAWCETRMKYTSGVFQLHNNFAVPRFDVPELVIPADDVHKRNLVLEKAPGERYEKGFNENAGDTGLLFKMSGRK